MVWDKSAQKLAYLAEKKVAKAKPFFSSNVKAMKTAQDNPDDKKKADLKVTTNALSNWKITKN